MSQTFILFLSLILGTTFCLTQPLGGQETEWEKKSEARWKELEHKNGEGTDSALKAELLKMRDTDQDIRKRIIEAPPEEKKALEAEQERIDDMLTARLKEIVASKGWPTIRLVGIKASSAASLVLIHSLDHEFQRKMLPELQKLVERDEIAGSDVATLIDKILVADGKPQRFGTQFAFHDGKMVMEPVEDPKHLEQRREKYLLPPMAEYKKLLADFYHMPVE
jgi:hypothetical protein